jgi:hypothetical protein
MSMMTINCPKCGAEARLSLANNYSGLRGCWKCHESFRINIINNQVTFCESSSKENSNVDQEVKKAPEKPQSAIDSSRQEDADTFQQLAGTSRGGIDFSKLQQPELSPKTLKKPQDSKPLSTRTPSSETEAQKPKPVFHPDRIQTFVPLEDFTEEPEKPKKATPPPERFNYFIPPAT